MSSASSVPFVKVWRRMWRTTRASWARSRSLWATRASRSAPPLMTFTDTLSKFQKTSFVLIRTFPDVHSNSKRSGSAGEQHEGKDRGVLAIPQTGQNGCSSSPCHCFCVFPPVKPCSPNKPRIPVCFQGIMTTVIHVMDRSPMKAGRAEQCQKMCATFADDSKMTNPNYKATLSKSIEKLCAPVDSYAACLYHTVKFDVNTDM